MPRVTPSLLLTAWALLPGLAWGGDTGNNAGQDWRALVVNSPFGSATATTESAFPGAMEFRGMIQEGGDVWVNLYDPASKRSEWNVVPGSTGSGLKLESYDPATKHLVIVQAGRRLDLPLRQARVLLPADIRPLVVPVTPETPAGEGKDRASFVRQLPPDAREMLEQTQRRRHPLVPDRAAGTAEFTTR